MQFDIIIVGGGMVGASLASALQSSSHKIALVDASPLVQDDHRLIALNYSSVCILKNLHIWPKLESHACAIDQVHVSQRGHFGVTRLRATEAELPVLGYVIPAQQINAALYENLTNVTLLRPATVKQLTQDDEQAVLTITTPQGEKTISGKIIIGADGTHSTIRELLNISVKKIDYQQSALVTVTELNRPHQHIAHERFLKNGAIAMLPLTQQRAATIWTDNNDVIRDLMLLSDEEFLQHLQKYFGYRLGRLNKIAKRYVYPLQFIEAEKQIQNRVLLVGNAAHTLHPIAAQGLNLALYEMAMLAENLNQELSLTNIESLLKKQQKFSLKLSHYLSQLFSQDFFILKKARQIGMLGLDLSPRLKKHFVWQTQGFSATTPTLCMEHTNDTEHS